MRFAFTEDQLAMRDAVRDLLANECRPEVVRSAWPLPRFSDTSLGSNRFTPAGSPRRPSISVESPASRLSGRTTRNPRPTRSWTKGSGQLVSWAASPITRSNGSPAGSPSSR